MGVQAFRKVRGNRDGALREVFSLMKDDGLNLLWPGLGLGVDIRFDDGESLYVEVPKHDSNIGEMDPVRNRAVMDNFIRVEIPIPQGAKKVAIIAHDPGVDLDRVGVAMNDVCLVKTLKENDR